MERGYNQLIYSSPTKSVDGWLRDPSPPILDGEKPLNICIYIYRYILCIYVYNKKEMTS